MKVENITSNNGNKIANQFIITDDEDNKYFQSYSSMIVKKGFETIYDIQLSEYNIPYINRNDEAPQTFQILEGSKKLKIKWFHDSEDEAKVF